MSTYKLIYNCMTGPVESFKYMFHYGGIKFEDILTNDKKQTTSISQNAILDINGKKYSESKSIGRYIARKCMLYGSDKDEALEIETTIDFIENISYNDSLYDWNTVSFRSCVEHHNVSKNISQRYWYKARLFRSLNLLEKQVSENNGYFVRGKLSWADMLYAGYTKILHEFKKKNLHQTYPELKKLVDKVYALPNIKAYFDIHPTIMPSYSLVHCKYEITNYELLFKCMFHYGNISFHDIGLIPIEWMKYNHTKKLMNNGIILIDYKYNELEIISRYLAEKCMLYGSNEEEALEIDNVIDSIKKIDSGKKSNSQKNQIIASFCNFEQRVKQNGGYFVCGKLSLADIFYVTTIETIWCREAIVEQINNSCPELQKLMDKVHVLTRAYLH